MAFAIEVNNKFGCKVKFLVLNSASPYECPFIRTEGLQRALFFSTNNNTRYKHSPSESFSCSPGYSALAWVLFKAILDGSVALFIQPFVHPKLLLLGNNLLTNILFLKVIFFVRTLDRSEVSYKNNWINFIRLKILEHMFYLTIQFINYIIQFKICGGPW